MAGGFYDILSLTGVWLQAPPPAPATPGFIGPLHFSGVWIWGRPPFVPPEPGIEDTHDGWYDEQETPDEKRRRLRRLQREREDVRSEILGLLGYLEDKPEAPAAARVVRDFVKPSMAGITAKTILPPVRAVDLEALAADEAAVAKLRRLGGRIAEAQARALADEDDAIATLLLDS